MTIAKLLIHGLFSRRKYHALVAMLPTWLMVAFGVISGASIQAQMITNAYEGFNYSSGPLAGQNGGTGWSGAWVKDYGPGSTLQVSSTGLTYPGLTTTGGSAVWGSGGNGISEDARSLPLLDNGI